MESLELIKIQEMFEKLYTKIDSLSKEKPLSPIILRSEKLDKLGIALAQAQAEIPIVSFNKTNPYFGNPFSDYANIVKSSRPALTKYGLSVTQDNYDNEDGSLWLDTLLLHGESDQWILSHKRIVSPKNDIQTLNNYITQMKKICYASLVGVVCDNEDDDGEISVATTREAFAKGTALNTKYNPKETSPEVITREQLEEAEYELSEYPDICEMVLEGLKIQSLADMPKAKYMASMQRIREIKNMRNGK